MVTPYIVFDKECEEAVNFYEKVLNGKNKKILRYGKYIPDTKRELPSNLSNYVLHATMKIFNTEFTFADEFSEQVIIGNNLYLTINPATVKEAKQIHQDLKADGKELLVPTATFYSEFHSTVKDKYNILWNIIVISKTKKE